jgi:proline dehydrogenase
MIKMPIGLAKRFVAGETSSEAIRAVEELQKDGFVATLDLLGENVESMDQADAAIAAYKKLFEQMSDSTITSGVSIKLTQLGLDFGVQICLEKVRQVLQMAKEHRIFVRIDMEGSDYTHATIDIFEKLHAEFDNVGLVLQAYLHRSMADVQRMAEMGASIRVCKGAYKEPAEIAIQNMPAIREQYKAMVQVLLEAGCKTGIATHDDNLIDWAIEWTTAHHIDRSLFEFQMLYGLRRNKGKSLIDQGYRVRSYVPYGTHWFPYFSRRLRERKENLFFVIKSLLSD